MVNFFVISGLIGILFSFKEIVSHNENIGNLKILKLIKSMSLFSFINELKLSTFQKKIL